MARQWASPVASRTRTHVHYIIYSKPYSCPFAPFVFPSLSYTSPPALPLILFPSLRPLYVLEQFSRKISRFAHVLYVFLRMFAVRPLKKSKKTFTFFLGRKVLSFKKKPIFCEPLPPYFVIFFHKNIWSYRRKLVLLHSQMRPRPHERKKKKRSLEYLHNF